MYQMMEELPKKYGVTALVRMEKVRASQLLPLRKKLKGEVEIISIKDKIAQKAFEKLDISGIKKLKENLEIKDFFLRNPGSTISNLIVEKDIFIGLGGFDDYINPSYDKDFLMRAIYFGYKYHVLEENLVTQRKHNNEQLTDINKEFLIGIKKFFKKHELHASLIIKIKFWIKFLRMIIKLFKLKKNKI